MMFPPLPTHHLVAMMMGEEEVACAALTAAYELLGVHKYRQRSYYTHLLLRGTLRENLSIKSHQRMKREGG